MIDPLEPVKVKVPELEPPQCVALLTVPPIGGVPAVTVMVVTLENTGEPQDPF